MYMAADAYHAPQVSDEDVTAEFVRDELLRCFESANREFFEILDHPATDTQLREQVHSFVTGVFQQCGVSFDSPTKEGILIAIDQCRSNAEQMMGERGADVIRDQYAQMMKLVSRLPEYAGQSSLLYMTAWMACSTVPPPPLDSRRLT